MALLALPLFISVALADDISDALLSGDARVVTEVDDLLIATIDEIDASATLLSEAKKQILNLNADGSARGDGSSITNIHWDPTHDAAILTPTPGVNTSLLRTNAVTNSRYTILEENIAVIGETAESRYLVMGSNPMRNVYRGGTVNSDMQQLMENAVSWLTERSDLKTAPFDVVIAQMGQSRYFPDEVANRDWLSTHYPGQINFNDANTCDGPALSACLSNSPDLLLISQIASESDDIDTITNTVQQAMATGVPVLYVHHNGNLTALGAALLRLFSVEHAGDNYWRRLQLEAFDPSQHLNQIADNLLQIKTVLTHFLNADYDFDWSSCVGENCSAVTGLQSEFQDGASAAKALFDQLDKKKIDIFDTQGYRLQKLLVLLADRLRQDVSYPMDKISTDDNTFLRSYFADHITYSFRTVNPAQPDMGNFSRSDFSHVTPVSRGVSLISKKNFRSSGVYALPGHTFSVTRNDQSDLSVKVFINTLRAGATHQWASNGYKRPKYLQSNHFEIDPGETIQLTSAYGGPIQLEFSANDLPVEMHFEQVGEHPYWQSSNDDASFAQKLDAGDYDWAELATPGFEIHSKLDKMRSSMNNPTWGSAQALATGTLRYMHNFPHLLAGFQGPGIDIEPEVHDFASSKGWTLDLLDKVKHMNADQATCGYGCSGNPYDAYWAYNPIGHGDVHELGHGLQGGMRFIGWENHSMTNHYSYYTKSKYHQLTGGPPRCQSLAFEQQFNLLQDSINQVDPAAYLQTNLWDTAGWKLQASMFIQMLMSAQQQSDLDNGWHVRARLHVMEREFMRADNNETDWLAKRESLGFSNYSREEARAINNNDWLLIAISVVTGLDYRDYLSMWGIPTTSKAQAQVASFSFESAPRRFYISNATGYCVSGQNGDYLGKASLPVDGQQAWPDTTDNDNDGAWDSLDNCLGYANPSQLNNDRDALGDACDDDDDNDGLPDSWEMANGTDPLTADSQDDPDGDHLSNAEEYRRGTHPNANDSDADSVFDDLDNCATIANTNQADSDGDGIGDVCDAVDDSLCIPITTPSGSVSVICL